MNAPTFLGPPLQAWKDRATCRTIGADGVTREAACVLPVGVNGPMVVRPDPAPVVVVTAAPAAAETNWLLIGAIALGIYLLTKG